MKRFILYLLSAVTAASAASLSGNAQSIRPASGRPVLYASVGEQLTRYEINVADATLTRQETVTLPDPVQYVWPHPSKKYLYVAWSKDMSGAHAGVSAFTIDPSSGRLSPHGDPIALAHRPVHLTVDPSATHVLVAYNNPSGVSVHLLKPDGTLGSEVRQAASPDGGIYAHQIRVDPSGQMAILVTRGNGPTSTKADGRMPMLLRPALVGN